MSMAARLLSWYDQHQRKLPWRETRDPYAIWVSETMLQQTRVETVIPYFQRFMERFPTLQALSAAPEADVLKHWEGLGYYQRARNLHGGAKQVMDEYGGLLPCDVDGLLSIRGIGPYTAGAIASIAFDMPVAAVDGNVIRAMARLCNIEENAGIPSVKRRISSLAQSNVPDTRPGDYNQAMMDLGATICIPGTPNCDRCPLTAYCIAYREGDPSTLPVLPLKKPQTIKHYHVLLIQSPLGFLMTHRKEKLLQGMWVFPMMEKEPTDTSLPGDGETAKCHLPVILSGVEWTELKHARHVFTHLIWEMDMVGCTIKAPSTLLPEEWRWMTPQEMEEVSLPTAMRVPKHLANDIWDADKGD